MRCPRCQHENRPQARFCEECATPLLGSCSSCGSQVSLSAKFCPECAHPVATGSGTQSRFASPETYTPRHLAEKILTSRATLEGERKPVTVLFADLVNSTALAERLGAEAMHALLSRFFELAMAEVHRFEGTINQFLGDGFMALFGAPIAHEDHARRAVLAAWAIQRQVREQALGLEVRMGLNTGPVVVGAIGDNLRMDYTAIGDTTNVAARIQQVAGAGTVLLGEATYRLVSGSVRVEALAPVAVKGKKEPIPAYRLLGLGPRRSPLEARAERSLSRFVGRGRELSTLQELLAQAERGRGQVVGIAGEPGLGKSRLLHEFRLGLAGRDATYLEGRCLSYGSSIPYLPILDIVRENCGISDADTPETIADKLRFGLHEVGMDATEAMPHLLHLLGMKEGTEALGVLSPEAVKARTFETLRQWTLRGSRRRPLILAVEDLHWIDRTSEQYVATLVESLAGAPLLLVSTYRPGYQPGWLGKSYATQIALRPLSPEDDLALLRSAFGLEEVPEPLARVVLDKAEGNPFFLEELSRALGEPGGPDPMASVPDTIQGVLMARIDRLPTPSKRLLQTASVLGRNVPLRLLEALWDEPDPLARHLAELGRLEFLYEEARGEEPVYLFKHVLTQEVAYESLLTPRRQALHAAAGRALERLYADRLELAWDRLAYHYARTAEPAKAVEYLTRLAEKAARGFAHSEAVAALKEALAHAERLPEGDRDRRVLELVHGQAQSLHFLGRRQEAVSLLRRHQEALERLQDPSLAGPYFFTLGFAYSFLGDREQAGHCVMRAFAAATECGDQVTMGMSTILVGLERAWSGQISEARALGRQAVALLEPTPERSWLAWAHYVLAFVYIVTGEFDLVLETAAQVEAIGEATGDRRLRSLAASLVGITGAARREWDIAFEAHRRALDLSPDAFETALLQGFLGSVHLLKEDRAEAVAVLEEALRQAKQYRSRQVQGWFTIWLGSAYLLDGQVDKAGDLARSGLGVCAEVNYRVGVGEGQMLMGRVAWAQGDLPGAEEYLGEALRTFASMQARPYVAETHAYLAALAHARGDQDAARAHLREARDLSSSMRVPRGVERTEELARELGIGLGAAADA